MKVFTKLGITLLVVFITTGMLWAQSSYDIGPKKPTAPIASEAMFDLQFDWPVGVGGGEAGIETDGSYIYTTKWNGSDFYRYQMDGTYIESFTCGSAASVRDLAYDGTYFYGGAASPTVYEMDFDAQNTVSTFSAPTDCRAIAYNEEDDAFYANNWGSAITKFDKTGANLGSWSVGPIGDSYYGFAYDNYSPGAPFLWGYAQVGTTLNELIQMSLPDGAETGTYFDVGSVAAVGTGIAGGMAIDDNLVSGFWTIIGTSQNVNIWGLELTPSGPPLTDDIGVSAIVAPSSGVNLGSAEVVTITVKNHGTEAQSNFDVDFTLDGGTPVTETISATINGGDTYDHTFGTTVDLSALGDYVFVACTYLAGDENPGNDCKTKTVSNNVPEYCDASTTTEDEWIMDVICGDINNLGTGWQGGVADYTDQWTTIDAGASEDITIENGNAWTSDIVYCWVDWNMDYVFEQGGNEEFQLTNVGGAGQTFTGAISVPAGTGNDLYRMRVRMTYSTAPTPCGNSSYGEVEDYSIMVGEAVIGHLDGTVTAVGGGAIEGATVTLDGTSYSGTTGPGGTYLIENINIGNYTAECTASGYQTATAPVTITENVTTTQDFELEEASMLDPPINFDAVVQDEDDVYCTWEPPGGGPGPGEWIYWDAGVNTGNGIGLTNGGTFYVASHWLPAELTAYDGYNLTQISFFANGDAAASYELMVWTGANAGTLVSSQVVSSFTVDDWNEVALGAPVTIDASQELWFGYNVTHAAGTFPAGCDDGPAIQYSGDMIALDGTTWVSMSAEYGLDYNWNIWGWVEETDAVYPAKQLVKEYTASTGSIAASGTANTYNKFVPTDNKDLLGYNVYNSDELFIDYTTALEYLHTNVPAGTYDYWATAVYDEGESGPSNTDEVTIEGGSSFIFCDDFESYNVGEQLVVQNPDDWTTWSGAAGNAEDPYIIDQDGNAVNITGTNDLVYLMPNYTSGYYEMTFDIYIPDGGDGYFNTLQEFDPTPTWGMQVYFGHTNYGEGNIDGGGALAQIFTFDYDTWMAVKVTVDLDADWGEFFLDDVLIHGWIWSSGTFGTGTLNQLGANNFYAWDGGVNANPNYYFDNYCLGEGGVPPPPLCTFFDDFEAYNVDEQLVVQNPVDWTTWSGAAGNAEDPYVIDFGGNVVNITGTNDLVYVIPNYITGYYEISFDMYVPDGGDGYFNTLQEFAPVTSWGMQVYFGHTNYNEGNIDAGGALAQIFTFDYDTWMAVKVTVDLDADWGEFFLDDVLIHGWVWSTGAFGTNTLNQLGGSNFFAWDGGVYANPNYYFDNYCYLMEGEPLDPPQNPFAEVVGPDLNDVHFTWDPPSGGSGELIELVQHDGTYSNAYYQAYDNGYGVVYDISAYPDCTLEFVDYRHSPWGITGTWDYKLHVVDWDTYTEVYVTDVLQSTGNDIWEEGIPLGSLAGQSGLVGVFLEPMSNDPADAYPCLDGDNALDGMSYYGPLSDYSGMSLSTDVGDFLVDLWIMTAEDKIVVKPPKVQITAPGNGIGRNGTTSLTGTEYTLKQTENTKSVKAELEGYNVFRNGTFQDYVPAPTTEYDDLDLSTGTYEYCVSAVYDDGESIQVCADPPIVIAPQYPPGPTNLQGPDWAYIYDEVELTWDAPGEGEWIYWDSGENTGNGIGLTNGGTFSCASRWYPDQLGPYNGFQLLKVLFYANGDPAATYVIKAWTGANGTNEVFSQDVGSFNVDDWNEVTLTNPVTISAADDFWFGYEVTHGAGTFPGGCDDGPAVAYNGDMISTGGGWVSMSIDYGLDYNWNIHGYVGLADGKVADPMVKIVQPTSTGTDFIASGSNGTNNKFVPNDNKDLDYYNVYRKDYGASFFAVIGTTTETEYTDSGNFDETGIYYYYVTAVWDPEGESLPSDTIEVDILTGIEEIIFNSTSIFPNPASDVVNIESDFEIVSLKVYSHTGQIVADELINNNIYRFDASQFNAGIYMFQIVTAEGTITKRIIIQ